MSDFHPDKDCPKRFTVKCETPLACGAGCLWADDPIHPNRLGDRTAPAKEASAEAESRSEPLKACPFCGSEAATHENDYCEPPEHSAYCTNMECGARAFGSTDVSVAIAAWNRRSSPVREGEGLAPPKTASHPSRAASEIGAGLFSSSPMEREVVREAIAIIGMMSLKIKPSASEARRIDVALFYLRSMEAKP